MPDRPGHLVVAGVTTRALAQSASRSGWRVTAIDGFGDLDLGAIAEVIAMRRESGRRFSAGAAARVAAGVGADAAAYTSNFENHPVAVALLAEGRRLLGNTSRVLEQIRSPLLLMRALGRRGFVVPATRASRPPAGASVPWLLKPRRSGGGHGTRRWDSGAVPRSSYLQARVAGLPGSITFLADGRRTVPLALSRQLVGERAFGCRGFRYCGSLVARDAALLFDDGAALSKRAEELAAAVTEEFGLVGLNGLDFIARGRVPVPLEVNPRFSASMELIERSSGAALFASHARACGGSLSVPLPLGPEVHGKAVVFARRRVRVGDTRRWLRADIADVPRPGERIARGHPICTLFATGRTSAECHARLVRRAARLYRRLESVARSAA